jgi:hypothetical protein
VAFDIEFVSVCRKLISTQAAVTEMLDKQERSDKLSKIQVTHRSQKMQRVGGGHGITPAISEIGGCRGHGLL